jgi:hypothetical protein
MMACLQPTASAGSPINFQALNISAMTLRGLTQPRMTALGRLVDLFENQPMNRPGNAGENSLSLSGGVPRLKPHDGERLFEEEVGRA